jgi:hypothetical protein
MSQMLRDLGNTDQLAEIHKREAEHARLKGLYQDVFSTTSGKEVLEHLSRVCHVVSSTFHENPSTAAFREGQRHVVLSIIRMVEKDNVELIKSVMSKEYGS